MRDIWNRDPWMRRAFGVSLVLHGLFALFFPLLAASSNAGAQPLERITFVHVARIAVAVLPRHQPLPRATRKTAPAHVTTKSLQPQPQRVAREHKTGSVRAAIASESGVASGASDLQPYAAPVSAASAQPLPKETGVPEVATADTAPNSAGKKDVGGVMPFGADLPEPVLDPKVRAELTRRFARVHVTLIVTVGDDGRTKTVEFHPPLDARVQAEISALLVAANWDAAVCGGGIPCAGRTTITL